MLRDTTNQQLDSLDITNGPPEPVAQVRVLPGALSKTDGDAFAPPANPLSGGSASSSRSSRAIRRSHSSRPAKDWRQGPTDEC
jgi:hypothetical protein